MSSTEKTAVNYSRSVVQSFWFLMVFVHFCQSVYGQNKRETWRREEGNSKLKHFAPLRCSKSNTHTFWTSTKHFQNSERNSPHFLKGNSKREQRENTILFSRTLFDPKRENKERTKREHHITLDSRAHCKERAKREQRENKERTPYYSLTPRLTLYNVTIHEGWGPPRPHVL